MGKVHWQKGRANKLKVNVKENEAKWEMYQRWIVPLNKKWTPHESQKKLLREFYLSGKKEFFLQCGRKYGKTEAVSYLLWRWALERPGSQCYYIAPFMKQAKEIIWAGRRLQDFGPSQFIKSENNTELRILLHNGSFIKVDGSENYEAYRGITPDIVVYDEFKDFRPEFHIGMKPNLAVKNAPLVIVGTPPDHENQYTDLAKEFKGDAKKYWVQLPTSDNPYISKEWLEAEKQSLIAKGEMDTWMREYEAKFVKGGRNSIFPMLTKEYVKPHADVVREIGRDAGKLEWYCIADPGSATCFAVLFVAINPYTKTVYCMDEIYETTQANTSVRIIGEQIVSKCRELYLNYDRWYFGRDDAATWFQGEMHDYAGDPFNFMGIPKIKDKEAGLSLVKDMLLAKKLVISDRCVKLFWEMENYIKDSNGKIPKINDHLIDALRYCLIASSYVLSEVAEKVAENNDEDFRGRTIEQDMREELMKDDLGFSMFVGDGDW